MGTANEKVSFDNRNSANEQVSFANAKPIKQLVKANAKH